MSEICFTNNDIAALQVLVFFTDEVNLQCSANSLHILQAIQFFCYDLHITAEIFFGTILFPCSLITKIHDFFFLKKKYYMSTCKNLVHFWFVE